MINAFVARNKVDSVVEFGCGDGNQLGLTDYPVYTGLDVSEAAVSLCRERFKGDAAKAFQTYDPEKQPEFPEASQACLGLSLDVIYHLVEDDIFERYMEHLLSASERYVVIYSSNMERPSTTPHVRHRKFTKWMAKKHLEWELQEFIPNRYPFDSARPHDTSFADFYIYRRIDTRTSDREGCPISE